MAHDRWAVGNREVRVSRRRALDWQVYLLALAKNETRPVGPRWVRERGGSQGEKTGAVR